MTRGRGRYMRPQDGEEYEDDLDEIRFVSFLFNL